MIFLQNLTLTITVLSVIFVIANLLTPDKYRKQMQIILSIISAVSIAGIVLSADFSDLSSFAEEIAFENSDVSYTDKAVLTELNKSLSEHIESMIKESGIEVKKVSVKTNIDDERCIFISKISLTIKDISKKDAILRLIESKIGQTEVEITVSEEVNEPEIN